jgi:formate dehydrogenase subunit gamma
VHDWTAIATWVIVAGHILFALSDAGSLRGMVTGRVSRTWARDHHPEWAAETAEATERGGAIGTGVGEPADRTLR